MEGTGSPERDRVNEQLGLARTAITNARAEIGRELLTADQVIAVTAMEVQLYLAEALVRQIRDLDDDLWAVKNAIGEANSELLITLNGGLDIRSVGGQDGKRGIFS